MAKHEQSGSAGIVPVDPEAVEAAAGVVGARVASSRRTLGIRRRSRRTLGIRRRSRRTLGIRRRSRRTLGIRRR